MVRQLIIGLACEGNTDERFLTSIIKRTYENVVFQYTTDVEILDIQNIKVQNQGFVEYASDAARSGSENYGILILCLHADADDLSDQNTFDNKIKPAINHIVDLEEDFCKTIVPVVPIRMTESWLLADQECFKQEIGTLKSFPDLGINSGPEQLTDPKTSIKDAIRIAFDDKPKRRSRPTPSDLYLPIGQKCDLKELEALSSYLKFKDSVKASLIDINYIRITN